MVQVTVSSGGTVPIANAAAGSDAATLQSAIAAAITASAVTAGANYLTATLSGGGAAPPPGGSVAFADAYINDAGANSYTVSSAYHAILYNPTAADTVYLNPGQSVIGGTVGGTFIGIGGDTLALGGGNNYFSSAPFVLPPFPAFENPDYVVAGAGNDSLFSSNGGTLDGGTGNNVLWAGGDTVGTTFISSGTDLIVGGGGADFATVSGGQSTLLAGNGSLNVSVSGLGDTIAGMGASTVTATLSGVQDELFGGTAAGALTALDNGRLDTVNAQLAATANVTLAGSGGEFIGGSGVATVTAASSSALVLGGTGNLTFLGNGSVATVVGALGGTTSISGGAGGVQVSARTGNMTISGGTGAVSLFGGSGSNVRFTDTSHMGLLYLAGAGNETLDASGSNGNDTLFGNTIAGANLLMKAGSGNDTIVAGPGNDTMVAGSGKDLFAFFNGGAGGQDFINGLTSSDTVVFAGYNLASVVTSLNNAQPVTGGIKITLSDNTSITFNGLSSLSGQNIF